MIATPLILSLIALLFCYALLHAQNKKIIWILSVRTSAALALIFVSMSLALTYTDPILISGPFFLGFIFKVAGFCALLLIVVIHRFDLLKGKRWITALAHGAFLLLLTHIILTALAFSNI